MPITFVAASANAAAASGNLNVTPPATVTDDIMLCALTTHDNVASTFPIDWTPVVDVTNTAVMRIAVWWKRCVGAEGIFTITHTAGDTIVANVAVFRGCFGDPGASPIDNIGLNWTSQQNAASSTVTAGTLTPTQGGCMAVFTMHDSDDGASSAQAWATLGAATAEAFDNASALGTDAAVSLAYRLCDGTNATGAVTGTISLGPDVNVGVNIILRPVPSGIKQLLALGVGM